MQCKYVLDKRIIWFTVMLISALIPYCWCWLSTKLSRLNEVHIFQFVIELDGEMKEEMGEKVNKNEEKNCVLEKNIVIATNVANQNTTV